MCLGIYEEEREIEREIFKASGEDFLCGMCGKVYAVCVNLFRFCE